MNRFQQLMQEIIAKVRNDGGDEIADLYQRVMAWYNGLTVITDQQSQIARAANEAADLVLRPHTENDLTFARNVLRFCVIPESHITDARRMAYIARATAGEDVYSYGEADSPTGIINVWDWDTRLILYPLDRWVWTLSSATPIMQERAYPTHDWRLVFIGRLTDEECPITITVARQNGESLETYGARSQRKAQEIEGWVNFYTDKPETYNHHHY